jgi:hypothetical protein
MFQLYALTLIYLVIGASLLLIDEYGGRYLLLIRLSHTFEQHKFSYVVLSLIGFLITLLKIFFPISPGPPLLGDLFPSVCSMMIALYGIYKMIRGQESQIPDQRSRNLLLRREEMFQKTGTLMEQYKRNLGYICLVSASLHFLFPSAVLL